jgi:hypothetical protein
MGMQYRRSTVAVAYRVQTISDVSKRIIPAYGLKSSCAFGSNTL